MSCLYVNYNMNDTRCQLAQDHVIGWSSRTDCAAASVQSIHEYAHAGFTYDVMYRTFSRSQIENITAGFYQICQQFTNMPNTRPDLDNLAQIKGDNGQGFGSGMATLCYSILGDYAANPTLIQEVPQQYWGKSIVDSWMNREENYLQRIKMIVMPSIKKGQTTNSTPNHTWLRTSCTKTDGHSRTRHHIPERLVCHGHGITHGPH